MELLLSQSLAFLSASKYVLLGLGTFFEGSAAMMAGGYLLRLGVVTLLPLYITLIIADIAADIVWYAIGYYGARTFVNKWGSYVQVTPQILDVLTEKFKKHDTRILIISKLTMGFGFAVGILITAGMVRVPFLKYMTITTLGSFVWVLFLIGMGYLLGNVLSTIPVIYQIVFAIVAIFGFLGLYRYLVSQIPASSI
jgi:membrane protein DedA with SNARE-associated domain